MKYDKANDAADEKTLRDLHKHGLLENGAFEHAKSLIRPPGLKWWVWTDRMLLLVGAALILSGIVFFFAYNWRAIDRFTKLGMVEGGLLACVVAALLFKKDGLPSKVSLFAASVLVGVFLIVFGQVYQTTADSFELILMWAALIAVWVAVSNFVLSWLFWLAVLELGVFLYWEQVAAETHDISYAALCVLLGALSLAAFVAHEIGAAARFDWLKAKWPRYILFIAAIVWLSAAPIGIFHDGHDTDRWEVLGLVFWIIFIVAGYLISYYKIRDGALLAIVVFDIIAVFANAVGKQLYEGMDWKAAALLLSIVIIACVGGAVGWLRRCIRRMKKEAA